MLSILQVQNLLDDIKCCLIENKEKLFSLNKKITLDTDHWIAYDYSSLMNYLDNFLKYHYKSEIISKVKAKGRIMLILSYNEPFVQSIQLLINALVVGNEVVLKPSNLAEDFVRLVWLESGIIDKYNLKLTILFSKNYSEVKSVISTVHAVYFFGSYMVAKDFARICGENFVEFYPEIETSDVKVYDKPLCDIEGDVTLTLEDSFTHAGQTCQRIQGMYINEKYYTAYIDTLKNKFLKFCNSSEKNKFIEDSYILHREALIHSLFSDLDGANSEEVLRKEKLPILVINPDSNSDLVKNAYFLPALWVIPYANDQELIKLLNARRFFLGLNVQSNNANFIKKVIDQTKFTRYTINTHHTSVRLNEGWGGAWPSGYGGYRSWIEHFSNGYIII